MSKALDPEAIGRLYLCRRPFMAAIVDDDAEYLEALEGILSSSQCIRTFHNARLCLNALGDEQSRMGKDLLEQRLIIEDWRGGQPIIGRILRYWKDFPDRFNFTSILISDYLMPGTSGIELFSGLPDWAGERILMSAAPSEEYSQKAFDDGRVERFIEKRDPDFTVKIGCRLRAAVARANAPYQQIWGATLSAEQKLLLEDTSIAGALEEYLSKAFSEWFLIGAPFGAVGMDASGKAVWIQLVQKNQLEEICSMAIHRGVGRDDVEKIRSGQALPWFETINAIDLHDTGETTNFGKAFPVGFGDKLLAAAFPLPSDLCVGYEEWWSTMQAGPRNSSKNLP